MKLPFESAPLLTLSCPAEACWISCATANPTEVVLAETEQGRGALGVIDGPRPLGVENEEGIEWRSSLLRKVGYQL